MLGALWICAAGLALPETASVQSLVDEIRREHGLPSVRLNTALQKAAVAHTQYMLANNTTGHVQVPGNSGFVARTPGDRARAFGYVGANSEAVAWGDFGTRGMVRGLFDAPYHRVLFLQPKSPDFGASIANGALCIKFGGQTGDGAVVSPRNGAKNVPLSWDGIETPAPLRKTNARGPVGYPIVVAVFGTELDEFRFVSATIAGPSGRIETLVLHPQSDAQAKNAVILIPFRPFERSTTYTADVVYKNATGERRIRTTFSTAS